MAKKVVELPGMIGPGVAPIKIKQIDQLADAYIKERDKRCAMTPREISAKQNLIDAIHAHADKIGKDRDGTIVYHYDDQMIILKPGKEKLQIKAVHADGEAEEE